MSPFGLQRVIAAVSGRCKIGHAGAKVRERNKVLRSRPRGGHVVCGRRSRRQQLGDIILSRGGFKMAGLRTNISGFDRIVLCELILHDRVVPFRVRGLVLELNAAKSQSAIAHQ